MLLANFDLQLYDSGLKALKLIYLKRDKRNEIRRESKT